MTVHKVDDLRLKLLGFLRSVLDDSVSVLTEDAARASHPFHFIGDVVELPTQFIQAFRILALPQLFSRVDEIEDQVECFAHLRY